VVTPILGCPAPTRGEGPLTGAGQRGCVALVDGCAGRGPGADEGGPGNLLGRERSGLPMSRHGRGTAMAVEGSGRRRARVAASR